MIDLLNTGLDLNGIWWWLFLWPPSLWFVRRVYRETRPPITARARLALQLLRSLTLSLLLLLLATPMLSYIVQQARYPGVVTLIDNSQSMSIREGGSSRWSTVVDSMSSDLGETLQRSIVGTFAEQPHLSRWKVATEAPPAGHATDTASALAQAPRWGVDTQRLHAVILISDGRHNLGADPTMVAQNLGVPVHTLGVGSATSPDDIQIVSVEAPATVFSGRGASLDLELRQWGFEGELVQVDIFAQDSLVASVERPLDTAGEISSTQIALPPLSAGLQSLAVQIRPRIGEITQDNNIETIFVLVRPHRLRVLVVAGGPSADFAFLRRTLAADSSLACQFHVMGFQDELVSQDLSEVDVLVLHDPAPTQISSVDDVIHQFVLTGGGLLFIAGERLSSSGGAAPSALPLLIPAAALKTSDHPLQVAQHGHHHPALRSPGSEVAGWSALPPLLGVAAGLRQSTDSTVLLEAGGAPVATAASVGGGRVLSVIGSGFWRLDLLASGTGESPQMVRRFWRQSVQWLGLTDAARRVRSHPEARVVKHGQTAQVQIEVFDELMQPFGDAQFEFQLNGQQHVPSLQRLGSGRYLASWSNLQPGEYSYELRALAQGNVLGEDTGRFVIAEQSIEMSDQRRDDALLRRISQASGGEFRPLSQWRQLADRLAPPPVLALDARENGVEISQSWWLLVLIVSLCGEWVLRKRWGLL